MKQIAAFLLFLALGLSCAAQDGKALFDTNCASCHGTDGSGKTSIGSALGAADLRSKQVQSLSDAQITAQIKNGKGNMPPFAGKLTEAQIQELVAYVRLLGKK